MFRWSFSLDKMFLLNYHCTPCVWSSISGTWLSKLTTKAINLGIKLSTSCTMLHLITKLQRFKEILPQNCHVSCLLWSVFMPVIFLPATVNNFHIAVFTFIKSLNVSSNAVLLECPVPDPSTANPISTEYNQKSRNSFCSLGLASLMGGKRLVSYQRNKN